MWGFFVSYDRERKQAYQTRVDGVAQVDDVLHEERGSGDVAWAWWPDKYKAVVADVVIKQWTEADVHVGFGPLWERRKTCMEAMDVPTAGAVQQVDVVEQGALAPPV